MKRNVLARIMSGLAAACVVGSLLWSVSADAAPRSHNYNYDARHFDGPWSVTVVTEAGACERAYRYGIQIHNGYVYYQGQPGVSITGRVTPRGQVQVSVRYSDQLANGAGRLSGDHGVGRWIGRSPTQQCTGYWQAERRGGPMAGY